jgi:hypothetical protein
MRNHEEKAGKKINKRIKFILVLLRTLFEEDGPQSNIFACIRGIRLSFSLSLSFYNLILFMKENEQNIENWQIKINNLFGGDGK